MDNKDAEKLNQLIQEIREEYCYPCGTQSLYCCCIYDTAIKKLEEITKLNEGAN